MRTSRSQSMPSFGYTLSHKFSLGASCSPLVWCSAFRGRSCARWIQLSPLKLCQVQVSRSPPGKDLNSRSTVSSRDSLRQHPQASAFVLTLGGYVLGHAHGGRSFPTTVRRPKHDRLDQGSYLVSFGVTARRMECLETLSSFLS